MSTTAQATIDLPLTINEIDGIAHNREPVATGVPIPMGLLADTKDLALLGPDGSAVPADFTVLARWGDQSVKWLLCDWLADVDPHQSATYRVTNQAKPVSPAKNLYLYNDTNELTIDTGVLRFILNKHGFNGFAKAWVDLDGKGRMNFTTPAIAGVRDNGGLVAVGADGETYTSALGKVRKMEVDREGKLHATVSVYGDLRNAKGDILLDYVLRVSADVGSSRLRMVCTVHNPSPAGRIHGDRWVLGQSGSVLFESLEFVIPAESPGIRRVTLSPEPGKLIDRIPNPPTMGIYQDSSGGENWFCRAHVNRDNRMPLKFKGYKAWYGETEIVSGDRAEPWIDLSNMEWGVAVGIPKFWQNFPKSLVVDEQDIRIGLWPEQFDDLHELQGGEQKTHEWTVYFHHRRRSNNFDRMPYAREAMATVHAPLRAWAPSQWYFDSGVFDPHTVYEPGKFQGYEAWVQGGINAKPRNMFTDREQVDEYGWRNYGDTWAANERDKTHGPHDGLDVINHYNHEYDHGYWMLVNCVRTLDAGPGMWAKWWELGSSGLWHEADIDLYHTIADEIAPFYNGGKFTHGAHGIDIGRSTHRGSARDELWGLLDWGWQRGSSPEAGHFNNRGILYLYLLTGDKHLLDAAWDIVETTCFKIEKSRFSQTAQAARDTGHMLQILTDAFILTQDERYLAVADKLIDDCHYDKVIQRTGGKFEAGWSCAIYIQALARHLDMLKIEHGTDHEAGLSSLIGYTRLMLDQKFKDGKTEMRYDGSWAGRYTDAMMIGYTFDTDKSRRQKYLEAAKAAFDAYKPREDGGGIYFNSKVNTIRAGGGGRWMHHATENP